ncbi:ribose 5-phosphate isomerase B [Fibrobacter sp. UWH5]|uniref:ribose 5-phosphate isomerase B n=1 Tax=Fibrobacter sp. UWH5 TaxID=1896211 RepID=UPI00090F4330|nr:ribose 5-phosphate isomerase B [Fibrobacter sp. UWH5]SHK29751.1 ribose 5-phosphate isomerase B [Fibrobacter sp. UWH5]
MIKKIAIGADHAGVEYKLLLVQYLESKGYEIVNVGTDSTDAVDYPIYAKKVCEEVASGRVDTGILICGTGIGMSMMANKQKGIRAAVCGDTKSAEFTRLHNDANVLCMGARIISFDLCERITEIFLDTNFMGGKHKIRIDMFE